MSAGARARAGAGRFEAEKVAPHRALPQGPFHEQVKEWALSFAFVRDVCGPVGYIYLRNYLAAAMLFLSQKF